MKDTIWVIKTGDAVPLYEFYENGAEAEDRFKEVGGEVMKYRAIYETEADWKSLYEEEEEKYNNLAVEVEGLRDALDEAKASSEETLKKYDDELRALRRDRQTLEDTIVRMAMRLVGM